MSAMNVENLRQLVGEAVEAALPGDKPRDEEASDEPVLQF